MLINLSFSFLTLGLTFILLLPLLTYIVDYDNQYDGLFAITSLSGVCFILSLLFYIIGGV